MISDHEKFSATASGVQNYAVVVAIVAGGIWTALVFWQEDRINQARLQSEQAILALEKSKEDLAKSARIDIDMKSSKLASKNPRASYVVTVNLHNHGTRDTEISWERVPALTVAPIAIVGGSIIKSGNAMILRPAHLGPHKEIIYIDKKRVSVGDSDRLEFVLQLEPGSYISTFAAEGTPLDLEEYLDDLAPTLSAASVDEAEMASPPAAIWRSSHYFVVDD